MKYTYFLVLFFSVVVPFLFSFHPKLNFYKKFGSFIKANTIVAVVFIVWDIFFTSKGVWSFNSNYILGLTIGNLPIEEILFFICIPFCCLFTIHCFKLFFNLKWNKNIEHIFVVMFAFTLLIVGLVNLHRDYTSSTFISTAIVLIVLKYYFKEIWIDEFFSIYLILLIPFFIVNGILTGTGLENPIVSYNDNENLGIRLLTIPVEDIFYGIELLLLNYFLYNRFNTSHNNQQD
jgi:lycopene cyclase domain-containing protein